MSICQGYSLSSSHVQMWDLDHREVRVLKNWYFQTVVLEKTLERPLDCKEVKPVNPKGNQPWIKDQCWSWDANNLATWCEEPTHRKRPWCWERLRARGEGDDRGWDSWMASLIQWTWTWANSERWWGTGRPGVLQSVVTKRQTQLGDWTTTGSEHHHLQMGLSWEDCLL